MYNILSLAQRKKIEVPFLDNLSEEAIENELENKNPPSVSAEDGDIHFEEIVEVDEIQKMLKMKLENDDSDIEFTPEIKQLPRETIKAMTSENGDNAKDVVPIVPDINLNAKKYVIYVDSDNVQFVEGLNPDERRNIINKILREENESVKKAKLKTQRKNYFKQALVVTFTFIIGFPIMFLCVNKSLEASMNNYQQAKQNFEKLYKQQGKIKQTDIDKSLGN